jgi:HAD superfamily hydrolase (TIGR01509 family)
MKSILFDFDGTLADTMTNHFKSWQSVLANHKVWVKKEDYFPLEGLGLNEVAKILIQKKVKIEFIDLLVKEKKKHYIENFKNNIVFYSGVLSLVKSLNSMKIPIAIVTAGHKDQLEKTVPKSFLDCFNAIVTGDKVSKNKPDPAPYLKGAKLLKLESSQCIAIENAPLGVKSAIDAGCFCIGITSTVSKKILYEANEVFGSIDELIKSNLIIKLLN